MKNISQKTFIIMLMFFSTFISTFLGCTNLSSDKKADSSSIIETKIQQIVDKYPFDLKLDTISQFQNKLIEPDDSLFFGNEIYLMHVTQGSDIGYLLYKVQNKFYVALIEWINCYKVIGISEITGLNEGEEFIELLYSDTPINSIIFGIIKVTDSNVKTVKTWKINNSKKIIEEISPSTVDFTETYNTDI